MRLFLFFYMACFYLFLFLL